MSFWKRVKIKMCCWSSCSVNDKEEKKPYIKKVYISSDI